MTGIFQLRATVVTRGWNGYRNKTESAQKVDPGEENSPAVPADSNPRPFNHESGALTTELSPPPQKPDDDELMLNVLRCHLTY